MSEEVWVQCPRCQGRGTVRYQDPTAHGDTDTILCPFCNPRVLTIWAGFPSPTSGWVTEATAVKFWVTQFCSRYPHRND